MLGFDRSPLRQVQPITSSPKLAKRCLVSTNSPACLHVSRPKPKSFRIKLSVWKKHRSQSTTDIVPVKNIIIHHEYNPQTYANDIALVQLEELYLSDKCMQDNPAVRAVCVPWSTQQFQPNDTCIISGWGRGSTLKWANVTLVGDCEHYFKDRFLPGMECAGMWAFPNL